MVLTSPPTQVAIIGGGLAGFTLALALHDLNISSTIYEARPEDFDQGGVGVYKRIRDNSLQFDKLTFKDGQNQTTNEYYFGSEKLYGYQAIRIMRQKLLDEMRLMLRERHILVHYDSKLTSITFDGPDKVEFAFADGHVASAPLLIGADGIHSTVRGTFLPQIKPMYAGFIGINCVVQRSQLRIPDGYSLPATIMAKLGAFLLVPQKLDGSELFIGSQRRFVELDAASWEALKKNNRPWKWRRSTGWGFGRFMAFHPWHHGYVRALATLLSKLSPDVPLDKAAEQWQAYRKDRVKRVLDLTQQMNAKRLPESERAKLPPGAIWSDQSLTRGDGGELRWLYDPDLSQQAERWAQELSEAAHP
ncbi:kynurenine 3-monooxygenase [Biscogniauxia marginata]|nr:kynurenine 3-monooxygenase [Biscogniauxia marginata]